MQNLQENLSLRLRAKAQVIPAALMKASIQGPRQSIGKIKLVSTLF
jgi:hypothetical protein